MKKLFFTIAALSFAANNVNAQLIVYSNGNVGVATSGSRLFFRSINNCNFVADCEDYIKIIEPTLKSGLIEYNTA